MKIEKLVRITAKSDCMDIEVVMTSKKATSYARKLNRIHNKYLESVSKWEERKWPSGRFRKWRTKMVRILPKGINQKISISIEPAGEILN